METLSPNPYQLSYKKVGQRTFMEKRSFFRVFFEIVISRYLIKGM